jgi:hypothetical protein
MPIALKGFRWTVAEQLGICSPQALSSSYCWVTGRCNSATLPL